MEKFIAWIPNTLGKLSFSYIRSDDSFSCEKDETLLCVRDVFSCDAYIETPFVGGYYLEKLFNFSLYVIQIPFLILLNFIIKFFSATGVKLIPEKHILTNGVRRFVFKNKMKQGNASVISDFRYVLVVNKERDNDGFFEVLKGRVYSFPLKSFGLWRYESEGYCPKDIELLIKEKITDGKPIGFCENLLPPHFFERNYFFCDVDIHRSGVCFLSALKKNSFLSSNNKVLEMANDERLYQQIFYFVRDCFHSHKHHSDNHDTLSSAYKYEPLHVDIKNREFKAAWIKNIIYGFVRHAIMNKNRGNYFDALGIMTYVDSFKKVVERGFVKTYPKFECVDPMNPDNILDSVKLNEEQGGKEKEFNIVHYVTSHGDVFKDNLEVLAKRGAFQSSIKSGLINKLFSNFTIGFVAVMLSLAVANSQSQTIDFLKELIKLPIVIVCLLALFFIFLDNLYSQGPRFSYTYKNIALSSFYANLKGIYLNNDDYSMSHEAKIIRYSLTSLIKSYFVPISFFVDYMLTQLPKSLFRYCLMIKRYPNIRR